MQVFSARATPTYLTELPSVLLTDCRMVKVGIQHGTVAASALAYVISGVFLVRFFHRYPMGIVRPTRLRTSSRSTVLSPTNKDLPRNWRSRRVDSAESRPRRF